MRTAVIVLLALVAIASAQVNVVDYNPYEAVGTMDGEKVHVVNHNTTGVHVVDNNGTGVNVVDHNPWEVHVVDNNPSGVHVVDQNPYEVHVVDNNPFGVHVVDNNGTGVHIVDNNSSGVHVVDQNPYEVHVVENNPFGVHVVDNNPTDPLNNPEGFVIDQAFYRPTNPSGAGYQQINKDPAFVNFGNPNQRPGKQYDSPYARGGK